MPIERAMREELYPSLNLTKDGISEFTFSNLYLFRASYNYHLSHVTGYTYIISGEKAGKKFFSTPCGVPPKEVVDELFKTHDYWKNLAERHVDAHRCELESWGYFPEEDRDNFDYLYKREDLAELSGKDYHKKRNLVNAFLNSYNYEQKPLTHHNLGDALSILDSWCEAKGIVGDYAAAKEGLELFDELKMRGSVYYVDGKSAGYALGESLMKGRMFAIHFEKAIDGYKGIYQFINQAFAKGLPEYFTFINREQDLGDEGLRQAKMTYRPCGFVKKYRVLKKS